MATAYRFSPYQQSAPAARKSSRTAQGAADFLRAHDKMALLLPTVARMSALQKDCAALLPDVYKTCEVLLFESDRLVFSVPNAALASKLKQQLPKLQEALQKRGWQVNVIRLKVQVGKIIEKPPLTKQITMPARAMSALELLGSSLDDVPRNEPLRTAIDNLIQRHRDTK